MKGVFVYKLKEGRSDYIKYKGCISAGHAHTVGLKTDGTVIAIGSNFENQRKVSSWRDIIAVCAGDYHTVGLKADGTVEATGKKDDKKCHVHYWKDIIAISAGFSHTVGLKSNGTVVVASDHYGKHETEDWQDIIAIDASGMDMIIGIKSDRTVVTYGAEEIDPDGLTTSWRDIIDVAISLENIVGLKADGTIMIVGKICENKYSLERFQQWKDIVAIYARGSSIVGLKSNKTLVADISNSKIEEWQDIIAISLGGMHRVGLKTDGTILSNGYNKSRHPSTNEWVETGQCETQNWTGIGPVSDDALSIMKAKAGRSNERKQTQLLTAQKRISSAQSCISIGSAIVYEEKYYHTVALKSDGTVYGTGENEDGQCNVDKWRDIIAVTAGVFHTVGLKVDGSVVATGYNEHGQCDTQIMKNIIAISAGQVHTVGLCADGTVMAVGNNQYGQCDTQSWKDVVSITSDYFTTIGILANGSIITAGVEKSFIVEWKDIVAISIGGNYQIGLKADGTIEHTVVGFHCLGPGLDPKIWNDLVAVSAGDKHAVGLKADGTVIATYDPEYRGLVEKEDGSAYGISYKDYGQTDVKGWRNIIAIQAGNDFTVGLTANGTLLSTGNNDKGQCNTQKWTNVGPVSEQNIHKMKRKMGICPYCGGKIDGLIFKKCTSCGK